MISSGRSAHRDAEGEVHLHRVRLYAHAAWLFEQAFWFVTFLAVGNK
jgi:hypothetical protein